MAFGSVPCVSIASVTAEARIITVIERDGAVRNPEGLNIEALKQHLVETGALEGFSGGDYEADGPTALEDSCDLLIPAALEGAIHAKNAERINARLIVEAANGPVTFEADRILQENGVVILPDLFANAGGVTVSYFEWVKNITHIPFGLMERRREENAHRALAGSIEKMTGNSFPTDAAKSFIDGAREIDLVRSGLDEKMRSAYAEMSQLWNTKKGAKDLRTAAYSIAVRKIAGMYQALGI
ncbi:Glu/Leu/Phe/Val family dehydrogenase [Jannaschia marina]|uniref:Glu/Leu/Phe/Val family dehydrogenase n=1 Tax=Jannaschia marina TaxID=2741674 RepID=UPI0015CED1D5|nr:hypothetical protein [Jannaschia marina]